MAKTKAKQRFWLCIEHGEKFVIQAKDRAEAEAGALIYGGEVIRELKDGEVQDV